MRPRRPLFTTADDVLLAGRRWLTQKPRAAVVLVHGFSASCDHPSVGTLADALVGSGYDVVAYDARGHGRSEGLSTLGDLERHDVAVAVEDASSRCEHVVLVGASMGAIAALRYAAQDHDGSPLSGVVTVSCPARWRLPRNPRGVFAAGLTRTRLGRAAAARWLRVRVASQWTNAAPPNALVPRLRVPLAIVHGADDRFVPPEDAAALFEAASEPRRLDLVPGLGHAFEPPAVPVIVEALDWVLERARSEA